jgi:hypothetical protein
MAVTGRDKEGKYYHVWFYLAGKNSDVHTHMTVPADVVHGLTGQPASWFSGVPVLSLDTGGYTGAWGPEGRMAMLH